MRCQIENLIRRFFVSGIVPGSSVGSCAHITGHSCFIGRGYGLGAFVHRQCHQPVDCNETFFDLEFSRFCQFGQHVVEIGQHMPEIDFHPRAIGRLSHRLRLFCIFLLIFFHRQYFGTIGMPRFECHISCRESAAVELHRLYHGLIGLLGTTIFGDVLPVFGETVCQVCHIPIAPGAQEHRRQPQPEQVPIAPCRTGHDDEIAPILFQESVQPCQFRLLFVCGEFVVAVDEHECLSFVETFVHVAWHRLGRYAPHLILQCPDKRLRRIGAVPEFAAI